MSSAAQPSSLATTLDFAIPAPPSTLLAPAAYARARAVMARLPASMARCLYLECRLAPGPASDRVDVTVGIAAAESDLLRPADVGPDPVWNRLTAFARLWRQPGSGWRQRITRLWLEFDIGAEAAPGVFGELSEGEDPRAWREYPPALARCDELLPLGAQVRYIGLFPTRGTSATRLCITGLANGAIASYLASIGWPGSTAALNRELDALRGAHSSGVGIVDIDVETTGEIGPVVGLEYLCQRDSQTRHVFAETPFVDVLVARGLCTAERRRALGDFPRSRYAVMPHELWESVLHQRVNHIKVTFEHDAPREAKAYLAVEHRPRRRRSI